MFANLVVLAHVLTVFWLVGALIARDTLYGRARRIEDLGELAGVISIAGIFEGTVRATSLWVLLSGLAAAGVRGWPILGILRGSPINWVLAALVTYLTLIPLVVFVFQPRGKIFSAALDEATARGEMTPRLEAALADPVVGAARVYELIMVAVLAWLMIAKPF